MSYGRDRDARHRGVGAIAAMDAVSTARARGQARRDRVLNRVDARYARVTFGPNRALPVRPGSLGRFSNTGELGTPPPKTPPPPRPPTPPRTRAPILDVITASLPTATIRPSKPAISIGIPPVTPTVEIPPPAPTNPPPPKPTTSGGGGGGGGSGVVLTPPFIPTDPGELLPMPEATSSPSAAGMTNTTKLVLAGAGLGLLFLIARDRNR